MEGNWEYNYSQSNGGPTPQGGTSGYTQNTPPHTNPAPDARTTYNPPCTDLPPHDPGADHNLAGRPERMTPEPPPPPPSPPGHARQGPVAGGP